MAETRKLLTRVSDLPTDQGFEVWEEVSGSITIWAGKDQSLTASLDESGSVVSVSPPSALTFLASVLGGISAGLPSGGTLGQVLGIGPSGIPTWISNSGGVTLGNSNPRAPGSSTPGVSNFASREDHVHPAPSDVTGNSATATKLATARKINGIPFDGSSDITIPGSNIVISSTAPADTTAIWIKV